MKYQKEYLDKLIEDNKIEEAIQEAQKLIEELKRENESVKKAIEDAERLKRDSEAEHKSELKKSIFWLISTSIINGIIK